MMKKIIAGLALAMVCMAPAMAQDWGNKTIKVDQKAPELEFPNPTGETLKLSQINKGRYVLLDFWASWCGPCRRSSPELVALYNKYKDAQFNKAKNGFAVVSLSLDNNKEAWLKAIADDGLVWPYHMSDLGGWKSKGAVAYGVNSIPQSMLIGPDGKVIALYGMGDQPSKDLDKVIKKKG